MTDNPTTKKLNFNKAAIASIYSTTKTPWGPSDVDKYDVSFSDKKFKELVDLCRFYYKHDPLASVVINKMVDIAITDIIFDVYDGVKPNEHKVYLGIKHDLKEFAESMALEYLLSGLVVPEIVYAPVNREQLQRYKIKKHETLTLPTNMWLRDPTTIKINNSIINNQPSYFVKIPEDMARFIETGGTYPDSTRDEKLYHQIATAYPDFVAQVKAGKREILLDNPLIIRRRFVTDSPYPIPYLYNALESLKHKRELRKMDYSIASRSIGAIQHITVGSDEFPVGQEDQDELESIRQQMFWRDTGEVDQERIFQLITNHTVKIQWVYPPLEALMNDTKYRSINQDIVLALGFPGILLTGETEKSNTSSPEYATLSPEKTMNNMRDKILEVIRDIVETIAERNNFSKAPTVRFSKINLQSFKEIMLVIQKAYADGNLSRQTYDEFIGVDFKEETIRKEEENKIMKEKGLDAFAPQPHSNSPDGSPLTKTNSTEKGKTKEIPAKEEPKKD